MANIKHLVKAAEAFHFRAVFAQQSQTATYANALVGQMLGLARGAVVSVNHLLSKPQYQQSESLGTMKGELPKLVSALSSFNYNVSDDNFYNTLDNVIGNLSFYTNKGNTGTGYDPVTSTALEGYTAPDYYVNALQALNTKLKNNRIIELDNNAPRGKDPIAVSLTNQQNKSRKV